MKRAFGDGVSGLGVGRRRVVLHATEGVRNRRTRSFVSCRQALVVKEAPWERVKVLIFFLRSKVLGIASQFWIRRVGTRSHVTFLLLAGDVASLCCEEKGHQGENCSIVKIAVGHKHSLADTLVF